MILYPGMPGKGPRSAEKPPKNPCKDLGETGKARLLCNRREGHTGRHQRIRYQFDGAVRAVWGD